MNQPGGQNPSQSARHFLHLLDDVHRIHGMFQEEIEVLRGRVKELEEANSLLAASFVPDVRGCAVYLVATDGSIQGWSGGAAELYGYAVEEIIGQPWNRLLPPKGRGDDQARHQGASRRVRKDGSCFEVFAHGTALLDEPGEIAGRICVELPVPGPGSEPVGGRP
jgi:PAS domain S-box-containing protein